MIVDTYLLVNLPGESEITQRLSTGWRDYLGAGWRLTNFESGLIASLPMRNPLGDKLSEAYPVGGGPPGSDLSKTAAEHLDPNGIARALVCHDAARSLGALPDPRLSIEAVRACNDWMLEAVLSQDRRLFGSVLLPMQAPDEAASDIRRAAGNPRWAAVMMSTNSMGLGFGHPIYHPIFEAAAEMGFPIVIDSLSDAFMDVPTNPTAAGLPSRYTDFYALASQSISTHLVSLIGQGVFERWPELKIFMVGAGVTWITPLLWRYDANFKTYRRDAPQLTLLPSEYFRRNVRLGTYPLDRLDDPGRLHRYLMAEPSLNEALCYASGYPAWNRDTPADIEQWLPPEWTAQVIGANALDVFRWPRVKAGVGSGSK